MRWACNERERKSYNREERRRRRRRAVIDSCQAGMYSCLNLLVRPIPAQVFVLATFTSQADLDATVIIFSVALWTLHWGNWMRGSWMEIRALNCPSTMEWKWTNYEHQRYCTDAGRFPRRLDAMTLISDNKKRTEGIHAMIDILLLWENEPQELRKHSGDVLLGLKMWGCVQTACRYPGKQSTREEDVSSKTEKNGWPLLIDHYLARI